MINHLIFVIEFFAVPPACSYLLDEFLYYNSLEKAKKALAAFADEFNAFGYITVERE